MLSKMIVNSYVIFIEISLWVSLLIYGIIGGIAGDTLGVILGILIWFVFATVFSGAFLILEDIRQRVKNIESSSLMKYSKENAYYEKPPQKSNAEKKGNVKNSWGFGGS